MRLTIVGCSGSFPSPASPASCYLVEATDGAGRVWRVLLDAGNGAIGPLQTLVDVHDIDAVLLSHLHPDHCLDLCGLYVALKYDPRVTQRHRVPVYGPAGTQARLLAAYGADAVGHLEGVYDIREWDDAGPVAVGPLTVTPRRVDHPVESYGMRVEHDGSVLAYTGDTDTCPNLLPLADGADLLLAEASFQEGREDVRGVHLTGRRAGQVAADAGAARLLLTHLPVWTEPDVVRAEARSAFTGPVEVVAQGQQFDV